MLYLLLAIISGFAFRALAGWRTGLLLMIVLAAIQDPLRKLTPGTPSWIALATVPVFLTALLVSMSKTRGWWREFRKAYPDIGKAMVLLVALSLPAAVISATYGAGSWKLTVIGAFLIGHIPCANPGFHFPRPPGRRAQADGRVLHSHESR